MQKYLNHGKSTWRYDVHCFKDFKVKSQARAKSKTEAGGVLV